MVLPARDFALANVMVVVVPTAATGLFHLVQGGIHVLAVDLHLEGVRLGDLQALGRGIGNGEGIHVIVGCGSRDGRGHGEVDGVADIHGLAVHIHIADLGSLARRGERVLVLRIEPAHSGDAALAGLRVGNDPQIVQAIDGGGHNGRSAGLAVIGVSHQVPAFAIHRDRLGRARLLRGHGQACAIGGRQRIGLGQFFSELADLLRIERRHVCGRIVFIFRRNRIITIGSVSGRGHGVLPRLDRAHLNSTVVGVLERGELVRRVHVAFLRVVDLQQRGRLRISSLCTGCAQSHATEQRRSGGDAGEKFPHLHENPLFLIV